MTRFRESMIAMFVFLVWSTARTVDADAPETERASTPGVHQNRDRYPIQPDPHYDPNSAFPWGADSESDDDPPFGIIRRGETKGSESRWHQAAGRDRHVAVRAKESGSEQIRVGEVVMGALRGMSAVLHRLVIHLRIAFDESGMRFLCRSDTCRCRPDKVSWPARERFFPVRRAQLVEKGAGGQGQRRQANEQWTGDIKTFLDDRKTGQVKYAGTLLPLRVTQLENEIRNEFLTVVDLKDLVCPHHDCPRFASCPQNFSSNFRACTNTHLSHLTSDPSRDPLNCPDDRPDKTKWDNEVHNPLCTHKQDATPHSPYLARISVLEDVYVSWAGHTFDAGNIYNQEGCSKLNYVSFRPSIEPPFLG